MGNAHMSIAKYSEWFRLFSANHKLIEHNIDEEMKGADGAKGTQSFHIFEKADIFAAQRSDMNAEKVNLFLVPYEFNPFDQNKNQDFRSRYTCAFTVAQLAEDGNIPLQSKCREQAETVVWDAIFKIVEGARMQANGVHCDSPFGSIDLDDFKVIPLGPIWEWSYGWYVEFTPKLYADFWMNKARVDQNFLNP